MITETELEHQIARAQEWYATHGWISLSFDGFLPIGADVNATEAADDFTEAIASMGKLKIVGPISEKERMEYELFAFGFTTPDHESKSVFVHSYKCEALPD